MRLTNYSHGPWHIMDNKAFPRRNCTFVVDRDGFAVARLCGRMKAVNACEEVYRNLRKVLANARVIEAGPELLEAACDLLDASTAREKGKALISLKQAVDKALGRKKDNHGKTRS